MAHVRPLTVVESALRDSDAGMPDVDNAVKHGVAVKTIRRWRRLYQRHGLPRGQAHTAVPCPLCDDAQLDGEAYSELLGWYLGDGHISDGRRGVFNLHIVNDARYVEDNRRLQELMTRVKPAGRPHTRQKPGCVITTVSWKYWPCLLPQHGPGRAVCERVRRNPGAVLLGAGPGGHPVATVQQPRGQRLPSGCRHAARRAHRPEDVA